MFLTTEPSLVGQKYHALRVIHATRVGYSNTFLLNPSKSASDSHVIIESALSALADAAAKLGADGVIGIHHTTSMGRERNLIVTVMGTAIKFY